MRKRSRIAGSPSRRSFLVGLAAAAAALPAASDALGAAPAIVPAADAPAGSPESAEVDALLAIVRARFGSYLQSTDMPAIRRGLERIQRNAIELQKIPMHNRDAPDCLFHPDGA